MEWRGGQVVKQLQNVSFYMKPTRYYEERNPLEFVIEIEKYCNLKNIKAQNHMLALESFLEGRVTEFANVIF